MCKPASLAFALSDRHGADEAGASFLPQAVAFAAMVTTWLWCSSRSRMAVATTVAEHGAPLADRAVRGQQHAAALVAARDELEEEVRGVRLERQIAEFVDDQQLGLGVEAEPLFEPALGVRLGQPATSAGAVTNSTE